MPNLLSKLMEKPIKIDLDEKLLVPDFRDIQRIPPNVGIFDEPTRCYRINEQWAKIVMGWVKWLATMSAWVDAENDLYPAIAEILLFTVGENCLDFQLRQSPVDNCIMEQSLDGGQNWTPVFDFSQCLSIVDGASDTSIVNNFYNTAFSAFQENVYNNYVNNYVNSITNIAPELGYGDADDVYRDEALCFALSEFINIVCDTSIEFLSEELNFPENLRNGLLLAGVIAGVIALSATGIGTPAAAILAGYAGLWASGIGILSSLTTALIAYYENVEIAPFQDTQAREELLCELYDALKGQNLDRDDFENVYPIAGLSANAQVIHDTCAIFATDDAMYAAFVENMRIGFNSAKLGLLPACPCTPANNAYFVDFTVGLDLWEIRPNRGILTANGVEGEPFNGDNRVQLHIKSATAWNFNNFEINFTKQFTGSFVDSLILTGYDDVDNETNPTNVLDYGLDAIPDAGTYKLCFDNLIGANKNDWRVGLNDNEINDTITVHDIKIWSDDSLPNDIPPNAQEGCT